MPQRYLLLALLLLVTAGCTDAPVAEEPDPNEELICNVRRDLFVTSTDRDAIPPLTDPELVDADAALYLEPDDRVLGLQINELTVAVPHNILWWHEIVNFDQTDPPLAVTYCPLTGSGIAFDRSNIGDVAFGNTGILFLNNLVMYDQRAEITLWPQMARGGRCGLQREKDLETYPLLETTWAGWQALHPDTKVLSSTTPYNRDYTANPFEEYSQPENPSLNFPMPAPLDLRRAPKERVLGLPGDSLGGLALPFFALDDGSPMRVVSLTFEGQPVAVFWDDAKEAAMAYPLPDASTAFTVRDGQIIDEATESVWRVDGRAIEGPRTGEQLQPVTDAYVAFWFAWAVFQPNTELWE